MRTGPPLMRKRVDQPILMIMLIRVPEDLSWCLFSFCFSPLVILDTEFTSRGNIFLKVGKRNTERKEVNWKYLKKSLNQEILKVDRFLAKFQESLMNPTTVVFQPMSTVQTCPQRENLSPTPRKSQRISNLPPKTSLPNPKRCRTNQSTQPKLKCR